MTTAAGIPASFVAPLRGTPMLASLATVAHTLAYDGRIVDGFTLPTSVISTIKIPTLVLDGGTTPWLSNGSKALASALPSATYRTLVGQQHDVAPEAVAPAIIEFLGP